MGFMERAIDACRKSFEAGVVSERDVRDVLAYRVGDISSLQKFLYSDDEMVRRAAARIFSGTGQADLLIDVALLEKDNGLLIDLLQMIGKNKEGIERLECILGSEDTIVRDEAIEMFRRAGKTTSLLPFIFENDEAMTRRIKRYFNESDGLENSDS